MVLGVAPELWYIVTVDDIPTRTPKMCEIGKSSGLLPGLASDVAWQKCLAEGICKNIWCRHNIPPLFGVAPAVYSPMRCMRLELG